ncbi:MAG: Bacteriophage protein [Verrucomicrobiota bacterium]|jgi:RNA polymerase sigma factor (sigma-70 family)
MAQPLPQATSTHEQDLNFVQRVLSGNGSAAAELRRRYHGRVVAVLCARGANPTEAEDLVADLWSDCFVAPPDKKTLLGKYQGRCALESWLLTVATHRLVDLKRRQNFRVDVPPPERGSEDFFERRPQPEKFSGEARLLKLLREAIRNAFAKRDSESVLMLKLVHLHQLTQREIARMWGWHESKVSRALEVARQNIARDILAELKRVDPWLELQWEDFLELCAGSTDGLF